MLAYCAFKTTYFKRKKIYKCDSFLLAEYERKRAKILKSRSLSLVSRGTEYATVASHSE